MSTPRKRLALIALICTSGCAGPGYLASRDDQGNQAAVISHVERVQALATESFQAKDGTAVDHHLGRSGVVAIRANESELADAVPVRQVEYRTGASADSQQSTSPSVSKPEYVLQPAANTDPEVSLAVAQVTNYPSYSTMVETRVVDQTEPATPLTLGEETEIAIGPSAPMLDGTFALPLSPPIENPVGLNLPSVLAAIDSQHPVVGQARWRVQQAYAVLDRAQVLWLPSIQAGFSFHRHDGNYQASDGSIVDVNRNSFQYGLGTGATGAGTTNTRPGIVAQFHLADAIFLPKVTEKAAWAAGHAANATLNQQLLTAASAYFELVDAHQDLRIAEQSRQRFSDVTDITVDFAEAGEGLTADADRLRTELALIDRRLVAAEERVAVAAARLAQAISLDGSGTIVPTDVNAIPLDLTAPGTEKASLIATALQTRPELKESQALVAAACEAYQREKYAPFVPSVLLGFSTGGFGGGLGNNLDNIDGRYDFDALLSWEVRNLGFGEKAARREQSARVQQARFEKLRVMDQVAREVSESHSQVEFRRRQIDIARGAIQNAEDSYRRNLERIRDGEGLPLEVLQSAQALESAQQAYRGSVIDYNQAQIRLQWALGFPVSSSS